MQNQYVQYMTNVEKIANEIIEEAQGQPLIFYLSLLPTKPFGVTCGGGYIDSLLTCEEYQNIKKIANERNIDWVFIK